MKAVVLENTEKGCTVLCENGAFRKMRVKTPVEVGSEICFRERKVHFSKQWAAIAAIFLLIFGTALGWNLWQPQAAVAYVSVDINPSLELSLDQKGDVVNIQTFNNDAKQVISGLKYKNRTISEVLTQIIDHAIALHYLTKEQNLLILGVTPANGTNSKLPANLQELYNIADKEMDSHSIQPQVAVMGISKQEDQMAKEKGLTAGQYALLELARNAGNDATPRNVQDKNERMKLYQNPAVKQQIENDKNAVCTPSGKVQEKPESKPAQPHPNTLKPKQSDKKMDSGKEDGPMKDDDDMKPERRTHD